MLIAACDTFRAGAVEQLRTHKRKLNALHPATAHGGRQMVELYEKGYGKDAAGIAMEAINFGKQNSQLPLTTVTVFRTPFQLATRASTSCSSTQRDACRTTSRSCALSAR